MQRHELSFILILPNYIITWDIIISSKENMKRQLQSIRRL